jgi:hypothetical protein
MAKNEVEKQNSGLPVNPSLYGEYQKLGFENVTREDMVLPFLHVLQDGSPQVKEKQPGYEPGKFINTATGEVFNEVLFVPATTKHSYVEWTPRNKGGGFVAEYPLGHDVVKAAKAASIEFGKYKHPQTKNDLVETFSIFGVLCDAASGQALGWAVVPFTSTKIKAYKGAMSRLNSFQISDEQGNRFSPPLFAFLLRLGTKVRHGIKGDSFVITVEAAVDNDLSKSLLPTDDPRFLMGAECQRLVQEGVMTADLANQKNDGESDEDDAF